MFDQSPYQPTRRVLHFDVNGTIIANDPASGKNTRQELSTFLSGQVWAPRGEDISVDSWVCDAKGDMARSVHRTHISYYMHKEGQVGKAFSNRTEFKAHVGGFATTAVGKVTLTLTLTLTLTSP